CAGCVAQEAVQVAAGREYERVAFGDDLLVGAHGLDEGVEAASLRALRVRGGIDAGGLGVGCAADLLHALVRLRLDDAQIALAVAEDLGGFALTFRAEAGSNLLALRDHALVDLLDHARVVVDALEANVQELDAELRELGLGRVSDLVLDDRAPLLNGLQHPNRIVTPRGRSQRLVAKRLSVLGGANDLDQIVLGDGIAD